MKTLWISAVVLPLALGAMAAPGAETNLFDSGVAAAPETQIDKLVLAPLAKRGIHPQLCSDAVFVRRAYLDVIGTLPTAQEARDFLKDPDPKKRIALIDRLLAREEFADYWAMKWSDLLRVKAEFPVNLWPNAAQAYHHWIRTSVRDNKPYDQFVREMLTANGSNFRVGPVNFYRAMQNRTPDGIAITVALTFMGTRADTWPSNKLAGMAAFFSQLSYKPTREWKEEVVFWDPGKEVAQAATNAAVQAAAAAAAASNAVIAAAVAASNAVIAKAAAASNAVAKAGGSGTNAAAKAAGGATNTVVKTGGGATNAPAVAAAGTNQAPAAPVVQIIPVPLVGRLPDGSKVQLSTDRDPREVFADWLIAPKNPWFAPSIVNRVWSWLMGRGIIHEPDDIRPDNPPSNPALLAYLQKEFVASHYDLKKLYRMILTSQAYQFSAIPPKGGGAGGEALFASYPLRQLDAEVLIDAINRITRTSDLYTSPIPEPFTFIPENQPAIALPDGSITSSFLELFGRPARATGMENERVNRTSPSQRMHLLNSSHIQRKIEESASIKALTAPERKPPAIIEDLYLTILSRPPAAEEAKTAEAYAKAGVAKGREAWYDLVWALINSDEFSYRH